MGGLPAVLFDLGIVDANLGRPRLALPGKIPVGERRAVEIHDLVLFQVLCRGAGIVLANKLLDRGPFVAA